MPTTRSSETNGGVGSTVTWTSPASNKIFVKIGGTNRVRNSQGTYTLRLNSETELQDWHPEQLREGKEISFGNAHAGAISPADDRDTFKFTAERGVKYILTATLGTAQGVEMSIWDYDNKRVASNSGLGDTLEWVSPDADIYYIMVSASTQVPNVIGTYTLTLTRLEDLRDRHKDTRGRATEVILGNPNQGAISPEDDVDFFKFEAQRGITYSVSLDSAAGENASVAIEDSEGAVLISNRGGGQQISWTAPDDEGNYYVTVAQASRASDPVGLYTITIEADAALEDRHEKEDDLGTQVSFGTTYQRAISPEDDLDRFRFTADKGTTYSVRLDLAAGENASVNIEDYKGEVLVTNRGGGQQISWTAPDDDGKDYYVTVAQASQASNPVGIYTITIEADTALQDRHDDTKEFGSGTQVSFGTTYQGAISPEDDLDYFIFAGQRGSEYTITANYVTVDALSLLVNRVQESTTTPARNFGDSNTLTWVPLLSGPHYIEVSSSPRSAIPTGVYTLRVTEDSSTLDRHHPDNSSGATRIGLRNEIAGAISPADDSDFFYFSAEGGKDYRVDLTLGTAEAVRFSVEGAAGIGFTASNFGVGNTLEWTAPVSGGYLLSVSASAQVENPIGTYQIAIRPQGDPRPPDPTPTPAPTPEPAPPAVEDPGKPALVVGSRVAEQGTTAQVPVLLRRIQGVTSLAFKLAYDPSVLRVARVMPGSRLAGATFIHNADTAGQVSFGLAATSDPGTDGSVAAVEFEVVGETGDMSPLTLSELEIGLSEGDAPEFPLVGGELRVETPMSGDADGDGAVTARDALIALKVIADASPGYEWLDLNGDGVVDAVDVDQILFLAQPG